MLTESEFSLILKDCSKRIEGDIAWNEGKNYLSAWTFRVAVESGFGWPLFVHGSFNPRILGLTFALILPSQGRIYGLDLGKSHRNPSGEQVGRKHKHSWSEQNKDKMAYTPTDITAPASDPSAVWRQFCVEARIQHNGKLGKG